MSKARIYIVMNHREQTPRRLVRAISQAHAVKHIARHYRAEVATQDDLVQLLANGVKVEDAGIPADEDAQS